MKKIITILLSLGLVFNTTAQAKLGETVLQVEARLGQPVSQSQTGTNRVVMEFHQKGFRVVFTFSDGLVSSEVYQKLDHSSLDNDTLVILLLSNQLPQEKTSWISKTLSKEGSPIS